MPRVADGSFTGEELEELSALWLDGWEDMTVAAYQEALWKQKDTPEHYALIERYGKNHVSVGYFNDPQATEEANAFHTYFQKVFEPLTGDGWQERFFAGIVTAGDEDRRLVSLEYSYTNVGRFEDQVDFYGWKVPFTRSGSSSPTTGSSRPGWTWPRPRRG